MDDQTYYSMTGFDCNIYESNNKLHTTKVDGQNFINR